MSWLTPAAFLGEFDAQEGPKINFAFEYFQHAKDVGKCAAPPTTHLVSGVGFVGRRVAGGKLHKDFHEFMREVAARVLTSNDTREESVLFQEAGCPAIGSFTFCLPDILARGEKRRFCIAFVHPDYEALVSRWPLITAVAYSAMDDWAQSTSTRYQEEYRAFSDLERRRDEARRRPLRSIMTLLSSNSESGSEQGGAMDDKDASEEDQLGSLKRLLVFFEVALPLVFASHVDADWATSAGEGTQTGKFNGARYALGTTHSGVQRYLSSEMVVATASVRQLDFDQPKAVADAAPFHGSNLVVRPLAVWLCDMVAGASSSKSWGAMGTILDALFTGNQLVIAVTDAEADGTDDATNLALALAQTLPRSLAKMVLHADDYAMPYVARILCFSRGFYARRTIVPFRTSATQPAESAEKQQFVLSEVESDGVVCVTLTGGRVVQVVECDRLVEAVSWRGSASPPRPSVFESPASSAMSSPRRSFGYTDPSPATIPTTTLSQRVMNLVRSHTEQFSPFGEEDDVDPIAFTQEEVAALRLLSAQLRQLVQEYVLRGRVYARLFHAQQARAYERVWGDPHSAAASEKESDASRGALRELWSRVRGRPADEQVYGGPSQRSHRAQTPVGTAVARQMALSSETNRLFAQEHFILSSSSAEDHEVLIFLGSASS